MSPELKTPPHRRLVRTDTPGIYRRGDRFVAITYDRGARVKTTHDTKRDACVARARRCLHPSAAGRERFEVYVERWLVEYRGRTSRGLAASTREAYAWTMRTHVVPYFRGAGSATSAVPTSSASSTTSRPSRPGTAETPRPVWPVRRSARPSRR